MCSQTDCFSFVYLPYRLLIRLIINLLCSAGTRSAVSSPPNRLTMIKKNIFGLRNLHQTFFFFQSRSHILTVIVISKTFKLLKKLFTAVVYQCFCTTTYQQHCKQQQSVKELIKKNHQYLKSQRKKMNTLMGTPTCIFSIFLK